MSSTIHKLRKLRGRSLAELRTRAGQAVHARAEVYALSAESRVPTDAAFSKLLNTRFAPSSEHSAEKLLDNFRTRRAPNFFRSFADPETTRGELRRRFPAAGGDSVIARAERILAGRFDLLGLCGLDFGDPIDWHLEPVSGSRSPRVHWSRITEVDASETGDKKIVWELNRHQFFQTLGRAYWVSGDERFARGFAAYVAAWMDDNPPTVGVNWISSLELAFRSISWLWALYFFRESEHLTPELFRRMLKFLYLHGRHLEKYLSTYFSPNTHLTGEALGLFYLGTLLPELNCAGRWRATGESILLDCLPRHVRPDGTYFEQTSYYHRYTADFYTHFLVLARANHQSAGGNIKEKLIEENLVEEKLQALLDHLMYITKPDGTTPIFGDDDGGRLAMLDERAPDDFRAALATGAALFGRGDYKYVAGAAAEETLWLVGAEALRAFDALDAQPPADASRAFPDGGYYVMRDGWTREANYLLVDGGPHGERTCNYAHAHADALAITGLAASGRTLLVDPGTYAYTGSAEARDLFRSTAAHNALTVDNHSSSEPGGPFAWQHVAAVRPRAWVSRGRFDFFEGEHNGYARLTAPATHTRGVLFLKGDYWVVRDRVKTEGAHRYDLHFQFAPGAQPVVENSDESVGLREPWGNQPGLQIFAFGGGGEWHGAEGWVSPRYAARVKAAHHTFSAESAGKAEFATFIIPRAAGALAVRARQLTAAIGGQVFELTHKTGHDLLALSDGGTIEGADIFSDGAWSLVRRTRREGRDAPQVSEILALGGSVLRFQGVELFRAEERVGYLSARLGGSELTNELTSELTSELTIETDARGPFMVASLGAARARLNGQSFAVEGRLHLHFTDGRLAEGAIAGGATEVLV